MRNINAIKVFSEQEKEAIKIMRKHALDDVEAAILWLLKKEPTGTKSETIENILGIRQPVASINLSSLEDRGFVKRESMKTDGKGRPYDMWYLKKPMPVIWKDIKIVVKEMIVALSDDYSDLETFQNLKVVSS